MTAPSWPSPLMHRPPDVLQVLRGLAGVQSWGEIIGALPAVEDAARAATRAAVVLAAGLDGLARHRLPIAALDGYWTARAWYRLATGLEDLLDAPSPEDEAGAQCPADPFLLGSQPVYLRALLIVERVADLAQQAGDAWDSARQAALAAARARYGEKARRPGPDSVQT